MSFETEYPLVEWPRRCDLESAIAAVTRTASLAAPEVWFEVWPGENDDGDDDDDLPPLTELPLNETLPGRSTVTIHWKVPVARAVEIAITLGATRSREELSQSLDAPDAEVDWAAAERAGAVKRELLPGFRVPVLNRSTISAEDRERFSVRPTDYAMFVDVFAPDEDEGVQPRVLAYSNTGDNGAAWVVLHQLCDALARELTALIEN